MKEAKIFEKLVNYMEIIKYNIDKKHQQHHIRKDQELTSSNIRIIRVLAEYGNMNMRTISKEIHVSPQQISKSIKQLELMGFVNRVECCGRNEQLISLTDTGLAKFKLLYNKMSCHAKHLFSVLTEEELDEFDSLLSKLVNNHLLEKEK